MRFHRLIDQAWPILENEPEKGDPWPRFIDRLIEVALTDRRLFQFYLRNLDAIGELPKDAKPAEHDEVAHDLEERVLALLTDRTAPVQLRVRSLASLGAVAGTLIGSAALDDLSDLQLAAALRNIIRDF
jgi:hypothetical protein